jgi:hypothetical protein
MFLNVDQAVGAGAPRFPLNEDTQLVQMLLKILDFYKPVGTAFSGINDEETIQAITDFQLAEIGIVPKPDGRVSVAHGLSFGAGTAFTIVRLNAVASRRVVDSWPRLDRVPGIPAPPLLFNAMTRLFGVQRLVG